jgi:hypothetical protein
MDWLFSSSFLLWVYVTLIAAIAISVWLVSDTDRRARFMAALQRWRAKLTAQPVLWLFLLTFIVVVALKPAKVGLLLWGICKLAAFAFTGDWCDARIFPDAQPDNLIGIERGTAWKRKGLIVAAAIIAGALLA